MVTLEYLKEMLRYDAETGIFYWIAGRRVGRVAGYKHHYGYIAITLKGRFRMAHRLAWFYHYGAWPADQIDHINMIKDDNRIINLREATCKENCFNRPKSREGLKGAVWNKKSKRWQASIKAEGKSTYLGLFGSEVEAHKAYCNAAKKLHGEFWSAT